MRNKLYQALHEDKATASRELRINLGNAEFRRLNLLDLKMYISMSLR